MTEEDFDAQHELFADLAEKLGEVKEEYEKENSGWTKEGYHDELYSVAVKSFLRNHDLICAAEEAGINTEDMEAFEDDLI